jgi:hypothetical protein
MDVLIPLGIIVLISALVTKRFAPERWSELTSKFKK